MWVERENGNSFAVKISGEDIINTDTPSVDGAFVGRSKRAGIFSTKLGLITVDLDPPRRTVDGEIIISGEALKSTGSKARRLRRATLEGIHRIQTGYARGCQPIGKDPETGEIRILEVIMGHACVEFDWQDS